MNGRGKVEASILRANNNLYREFYDVFAERFCYVNSLWNKSASYVIAYTFLLYLNLRQSRKGKLFIMKSEERKEWNFLSASNKRMNEQTSERKKERANGQQTILSSCLLSCLCRKVQMKSWARGIKAKFFDWETNLIIADLSSFEFHVV